MSIHLTRKAGKGMCPKNGKAAIGPYEREVGYCFAAKGQPWSVQQLISDPISPKLADVLRSVMRSKSEVWWYGATGGLVAGDGTLKLQRTAQDHLSVF